MCETLIHFKNWCFLCSCDESVEIEIAGLSCTAKETIGQFSFLNHTLPNMPSKICQNCQTFLNEIDRRKQLYAKVEQMYLELIRMPSRSTVADFAEIRSRHNVDEMLQAAEILNDDKMMEVQVEYVTESNYLENPANWNIELIEDTTTSPVKAERPKRSSTLKISHLAETQRSTAQGFQCDHCAKSFKTRTLITKHITRYHATENLTEIIDIKNKANTSSKSRQTEKKFECNLCSKSFKTRAALNEHGKTHSDFKSYVCPHCRKAYKTASTLAQHLDTHGTTGYKCDECGLQLNTRRTLRQHQLKHSEVVKHTCEFCQAQFKRTKTYKEHLICVHTDIKAYSCSWCSRTFSNGANCRKHKKEIHPEALKKADSRGEQEKVNLPSIQEIIEIARARLNNSD